MSSSVTREQALSAKQPLKGQLAALGVQASVGISGNSTEVKGYFLRANLASPSSKKLPMQVEGVPVEYVVTGAVRAAVATALVKFKQNCPSEALQYALSTVRTHGEPEQLFPQGGPELELIWTAQVPTQHIAALLRELSKLPGVEYAETAPPRKVS